MATSKPTLSIVRRSFAGMLWPRNRGARAFLLAVPWIDLLALAVIFFFFTQAVVLQPGKRIDLPEAPFTEGMLASTPTAILQYVATPNQPNEVVLILDDGRYRAHGENLGRLPEALTGSPALNVLVDGTIPCAALNEWLNRLRDAGVQEINLIEKQN